MTAEVILLPNQNNTEMPRVPEPAPGDAAYLLELEQENLDLRNALASEALARSKIARTRRRASVGVGATAAVLLAFCSGWLLDPPGFLATPVEAATTGQARPSDSLRAEGYSTARGERHSRGGLLHRWRVWGLAVTGLVDT